MSFKRWATIIAHGHTSRATYPLTIHRPSKLVTQLRQLADSSQQENPIIVKLKDRLIQDTDSTDINIAQQNGFKLFDIEQKFTINKRKLQTEMRQLQQLLHPDKFVHENRQTQKLSDSLSALVNDFYSILNNPYERGKYLLSLVTGQSQEEVLNQLERLQLDGNFLADMMEMREKIHDPTIDPFELQKLSLVLENDIDALSAEIDRDFESKNYGRILRNLGKMKFLANNHSAIVDRLD